MTTTTLLLENFPGTGNIVGTSPSIGGVWGNGAYSNAPLTITEAAGSATATGGSANYFQQVTSSVTSQVFAPGDVITIQGTIKVPSASCTNPLSLIANVNNTIGSPIYLSSTVRYNGGMSAFAVTTGQSLYYPTFSLNTNYTVKLVITITGVGGVLTWTNDVYVNGVFLYEETGSTSGTGVSMAGAYINQFTLQLGDLSTVSAVSMTYNAAAIFTPWWTDYLLTSEK